MAPESERANCPTSKRTGVGDCGEDMRINGVHHSCKLADDHEGAHECDCSPDPWRERRVQELEECLRNIVEAAGHTHRCDFKACSCGRVEGFKVALGEAARLLANSEWRGGSHGE